YPPKSTSVRFAATRGVLSGLSRVSPGTAARIATVLFRRPPGRRRSDLPRSAFDSGQRVDLRLDGRRLAVWRWGKGPTALLVHGWGSRGARLGDFVAPLTRAGFSVVAFDAPGHGASGGRLSSLPQFVAAIREIGERLGPLHAVVAHSMGGAATTLAMARGLDVKRAVFLAPAADPAGYSERFASVLGLTDDVVSRMKQGLERRFGFLWKDFDVLAAAATLAAPLLVIHDSDDRDVPLADGVSIAAAWPGARLVTTNGLGHRRIVHDRAVVLRAIAFLTEEESATRLSGRA
ncbi:MAG TPA: alpha/beta fold hydrolase, partial [Thermoanaerobaculia bacterium]|nr:alpha/beta fold hydrolase [Thermoanaerobaculia bacterium]